MTQVRSGSKNYWNGVNQIIKKVLNGKRTLQEAKAYMLKFYVYDGNSRKAFNHVSYEATSIDITNELKVFNLIVDAIKLGYGKDLNFENVYR